MAGRIKTRRARRQGPGKFRIFKPAWQDPFPQIPGTDPEKRIFEALVRRKLFFLFQADLPEFAHGDYPTFSAPGFEPDFVLPEYKLILDPFSPFHHSRIDRVKRDTLKEATYRALGYQFLHPWIDQPGIFKMNQPGYAHATYHGAEEFLSSIGVLNGPPLFKLTDKAMLAAKHYPGYILGRFLGAGAGSVALANHARKRPHGLGIQSGTGSGTRRSSSLKGTRQVRGSWVVDSKTGRFVRR
jgi:hypothetical protein